MTLRAWRGRWVGYGLPLAAAVLLCMSCESLVGLKTHTSAGGGSGGASSNHAGAAAPVVTACQNYCKQALDVCKDSYSIYHGDADCEPACQLLSTEQIKCRVGQLTAAATSTEFWDHCQGAAIGGSRACGGNCENYCALMDRVCVGEGNRNAAEVDDCVTKCEALRDRETSLKGLTADASRLNVDADHEGDTLQCRLVHLAIASGPGAAEAHCWHAAIAPRPGPGMAPNPCATGKSETEPHCEDYCGIVMKACTATNKVYENDAQCLAVCKQLTPGTASDLQGVDSVGCRKTHSYNALTIDQVPHCQHSGPGGAGICGTDCPAYCKLLKAGCDASFKDAFGTGNDAISKCESTCTAQHGETIGYSVTSAAAKGANPIACRLLYTARALEHPEQQAVLCKSAVGAADSDCK